MTASSIHLPENTSDRVFFNDDFASHKDDESECGWSESSLDETESDDPNSTDFDDDDNSARHDSINKMYNPTKYSFLHGKESSMKDKSLFCEETSTKPKDNELDDKASSETQSTENDPLMNDEIAPRTAPVPHPFNRRDMSVNENTSKVQTRQSDQDGGQNGRAVFHRKTEKMLSQKDRTLRLESENVPKSMRKHAEASVVAHKSSMVPSAQAQPNSIIPILNEIESIMQQLESNEKYSNKPTSIGAHDIQQTSALKSPMLPTVIAVDPNAPVDVPALIPQAMDDNVLRPTRKININIPLHAKVFKSVSSSGIAAATAKKRVPGALPAKSALPISNSRRTAHLPTPQLLDGFNSECDQPHYSQFWVAGNPQRVCCLLSPPSLSVIEKFI